MPKDKSRSRREFLQDLSLAGAGLFVSAHELAAMGRKPRRRANDMVVLGKSGIRVSRLGMGTGSQGGRVQRELGQEGFTRLMRYGIDQGLTLIDTADNYKEMHHMLKPAIKGVDRERIQIQSKISAGKAADVQKELDRIRLDLGTEYLDSFLIHCVTAADWPQQCAQLMDDLQLAKEKGIIRSHGVSIHGLASLQSAAAVKWIDVALVRVNHNGRHMDGLNGKFGEPGVQEEAMNGIRTLKKTGMGLVGMKLVGNGDFTDPALREAAMRYVMKEDCVHAVILGFKSPQEIDEAMERMNGSLNGQPSSAH